jgi:hypothetical protein
MLSETFANSERFLEGTMAAISYAQQEGSIEYSDASAARDEVIKIFKLSLTGLTGGLLVKAYSEIAEQDLFLNRE